MEKNKRKDNQYICAHCQQSYDFSDPSIWSEEDAMKEWKENFPHIQNHPIARVCDDCYKRITAWIKTLTPSEKARIEGN